MLIDTDRERLIETRRDLHRHPEIAHEEHRTAGIVAERLRGLGLDDVRTGVGTTGVVGVLRGGTPGRTVLLRADMDALPLLEADRGQSYRSTNDGVHHACGHDGHVAILLAAADALAQQRSTLAGTVTFAFQPAEERVGGAKGMLDADALNPRPDACFGLHLWNDVRVGRVDVRPGPIYASADAFDITLRGTGGHGAMPHQVADPVLASAELIVGLQTLVSRETPPLEPAVLTIGSIHGGTAPNIIPDEVHLQGTLRAFDPAVRDRLVARLAEVTQQIAATFRVQSSVRMTDCCPACINDVGMSDLARSVAQQVVGVENVQSETRTTGADDMSLFLNAVPGCYFFVGGSNPAKGFDSPHHSPTFDFDEDALEIGVRMLVGCALEFLNRERM
ncbi:MAG: amidohydrolase [Chloroflexi bacterium]|nr:amidohydrolase [Chloroflexota bacterium]